MQAFLPALCCSSYTASMIARLHAHCVTDGTLVSLWQVLGRRDTMPALAP